MQNGVYENEVLSHMCVSEWFQRFTVGYEDTNDDPESEQLSNG
jgi:hypothetical protein